MRYLFFSLIFSVFLIVFLVIINLPLRIVKSVLNEYFPEVTYSQIDGTIWSGKITGLSFANEYLGNLSTEINQGSLEFSLDDNEVSIEGKLNIISTLIERRVNLRELDFEIRYRKFLQRIPVVSNLAGKNVNMTFDMDGCYEASGNLFASLDKRWLLQQPITAQVEASLDCSDKKIVGNFYSTPNREVLRGEFTIDYELNYVLKANSAVGSSQASKSSAQPFNYVPNVKVVGNLYEFFY